MIVPPQAAILAVSAIKDRPLVRNGQLAVGKTMMVTVSCDHRIIDGVSARASAGGQALPGESRRACWSKHTPILHD